MESFIILLALNALSFIGMFIAVNIYHDKTASFISNKKLGFVLIILISITFVFSWLSISEKHNNLAYIGYEKGLVVEGYEDNYKDWKTAHYRNLLDKQINE